MFGWKRFSSPRRHIVVVAICQRVRHASHADSHQLRLNAESPRTDRQTDGQMTDRRLTTRLIGQRSWRDVEN